MQGHYCKMSVIVMCNLLNTICCWIKGLVNREYCRTTQVSDMWKAQRWLHSSGTWKLPVSVDLSCLCTPSCIGGLAHLLGPHLIISHILKTDLKSCQVSGQLIHVLRNFAISKSRSELMSSEPLSQNKKNKNSFPSL